MTQDSRDKDYSLVPTVDLRYEDEIAKKYQYVCGFRGACWRAFRTEAEREEHVREHLEKA